MRSDLIFTLAAMAALLAAGLYGYLGDEPFFLTLAAKAAIFGLAGAGLNVALGYGGLVSLGHAAFFGIGGYAAGILASHARNYQPMMTWPIELAGTTSAPLIWIAAMLAAGLFSLPMGLLSLRTGGVYFIMITLAFAQMLYYFAVSWPAYGGEDGLSFYVRNELGGLSTMDPWVWFLICYSILAVVLLLIAIITRSRFGLALTMARENPLRLGNLGIAPKRVLLTAFVISAIVTGLAGALYADLNRFVSPSMLSWHMSGEIMVFVILGGVGRLGGPVAGACVFILLEQVLGGFTEYWQFLLGIALIVIVLMGSGGIAGLFERSGARKEPAHG